MRKITLISVLSLLIGLFGMSAKAQSVVSQGSCGTNLTYVLLSDSTFTVYGSGSMTSNPWYSSYRNRIKTVVIGDSVTSIGNYAFQSCSNLVSVTIGNSVDSIGNYAFERCSSLSSLTIPKSVTTIGSYAFQNCSSLTSIIIPNGVTWIGDLTFGNCGIKKITLTDGTSTLTLSIYYPFNGCAIDTLYMGRNVMSNYSYSLFGTNVKHLIIGDSVTSIAPRTFYDCSSLTFVSIGNNVTNIGNDAFYNCSGLISVIIPNSVTSIGGGAFSGCSSLTSITIPNGVTSIGSYAFNNCTSLQTVNYNAVIVYPIFSGCTALTTIHIGDSVKVIPDRAFYGCSSLDSIDVDNNNFNYSSINGILYSKMQDTLVLCPEGKTGTVVISNSVTSIKSWAFYNCNLTSITIPNSVTSIEYWAFYNCTKLQIVIFNAINCTTISSNDPIFTYCTAFTTLHIGDSVKTIPDYAFSTCGSLTSVTIGNSVTSIGHHAFGGCSSLTSLTIPDSVASIGDWAFAGCSKLDSLTIGNNVTSIGDEAFWGCSSLTSLTLGNSLTSIGGSAFENCSSLTSITIPNSVTSIGDAAFYECSSLKSVTIGNGVTSTGDYTFANCSSLTSITIPNSITTIGNGAFSSCSSLSSITIPNSVDSIGYWAFAECSSLTAVTIPDSVTSIGYWAFYGCNNLTSITCKAINPPVLGNSVFNNVPTTIPVYVPCHSVPAYRAATDWNSFSNYIGFIETMDTTFVFDTICFAETYNGYGFSIPAITDIYYQTNACGDSTVCLSLMVYSQVPITTYLDTICYGTAYNDANFTNITVAGTYYDTLKNINDCDSIIELVLDFYLPVPITTYSDTLCFEESYDFGGETYTVAGTYYDTLKNINGCDSIIEFIFEYYSPVPITTYSETLCSWESYDFGGETYTVAGTYYDTLKNINGCDSIIEFVFEYYLSITTYSDTLCFGESYDFGGETYTVAGTYYDTLYNINGCDSIIEFVFEYYPNVPVFNYVASIVEGETYNDANFTNLTQAGTYCDTLENANGCDSVICLTLTVNADGIVETYNYPSLRVYPNPATNQLKIKNYELQEGEVVEIYSVVGQKLLSLHSLQSQETTIDVSPLANGMYFLKIGNNTVRFVKE